jgi:hypothetical protein
MNRLPLLAVSMLVLGLAACSRARLTNENLGKVYNGMTEAQVETILGKPSRIETGETLGIKGSTYYYDKGGAHVEITFLNNSVMVKQGTFQ